MTGQEERPPARPQRLRRMERRTPVWEAPGEIVELMGEVSGNELNGWGSSEARQPTLVMWAHPATIAHGPVQVRMTEEFLAHPQLRTVLRTDDRHEPAPVDPHRIDRTPAEWLADITEFATSEQGHSVELVAVVAARREWFFEGRESGLPWAILLAVAMDHGELATAPEYTSAMEVHRQYNRGTAAARALADWIRSRGFEAVGHGGPGAGPMQMVPAAIAAGLGELGKHGSIINSELGSSFRLALVLTDAPLVATPAGLPQSLVRLPALVLTDAPLVATPPDTFGVDEFCSGCRVCTDACPPDAIAPDKRLVRGTEKWAVDFDRCLPYFAVSYGCGICIAVCPWSTPGAAPRLADNMRRKLARSQADEPPAQTN